MRRRLTLASLLLGLAAVLPAPAGAAGPVKRQEAARQEEGQYTPGVFSMAFLASGLTALSIASLVRRRKP